MKTLFVAMLIGFGLQSQSVLANVTPAHEAMELVKEFLDAETTSEIESTLPAHKEKAYIVQYQSNFLRGKFSAGSGNISDYFGSTTVMVQIGSDETPYEVTCSLSATAVVVPFAKQLVPVLESVVNSEQLILKRHNVSCTLD